MTHFILIYGQMKPMLLCMVDHIYFVNSNITLMFVIIFWHKTLVLKL